MNAQELVALVKDGSVKLTKFDENKYRIVDQEGKDFAVSFMTARAAVKEVSEYMHMESGLVVWSNFPEPVPANDLDELDDAAFAAAVINGSGRQSKVAPKVKKSAKSDPGCYIGATRRPKRGIGLHMWELLDAMLEDDPQLHLDRSMIKAICEIKGWVEGSFQCQYRWWRLDKGLFIRDKAPAMRMTPEEKIEREEVELIDDAVPMDEVEIVEVA